MSDEALVTTKTVSAGGHRFFLNEAGSPSEHAVLFLHGSGPGATGASNWAAVLEDMGGDYYCLAPDLTGYGDSSHPDPLPQGIVAYTQLRVEALLALLDTLGVETATLVGNSMGGLISLDFVRRAPHRVEKLVLMGAGGAPVPVGPGLPALVGFYADPSTESMAALLKNFVYSPEQFGDELDDIAAARIPVATRPDIRRSHEATFDLSTPWTISDEELAAIDQETLVIHGREDKFVIFDAGLYFFNRIPNARIYGIGKCGHWAQIEYHDRFVFALRSFLSGAL